jgi:hypothetical protein
MKEALDQTKTLAILFMPSMSPITSLAILPAGMSVNFVREGYYLTHFVAVPA